MKLLFGYDLATPGVVAYHPTCCMIVPESVGGWTDILWMRRVHAAQCTFSQACMGQDSEIL